MPLSDRQLQANRRNSLLSTGPKTPGGKLASSRNAVRHGLLSRDLLLPHESLSQFREFEASLRSELNPIGSLQELIAERIITSAWRLRRALNIDREIFLRLALRSGSDGAPNYEGDGFALIEDGRRGINAFEKLTRYETHLHRLFRKDLKDLLLLQSRRKTPSGVSIVLQADPDQQKHPQEPERCPSPLT